MGLFNRNKSANDDINDYYASEQRKRVGLAWLLGLATLVVTVLLALGLFYGGRWVYRTVFDDNDQPATTANDPKGTNTETNGSDSSTNGLINDFTIDNDETDEDDSQSTTSNSSTRVNNSENMPRSGASPEALPSTGPSGPEELR